MVDFAPNSRAQAAWLRCVENARISTLGVVTRSPMQWLNQFLGDFRRPSRLPPFRLSSPKLPDESAATSGDIADALPAKVQSSAVQLPYTRFSQDWGGMRRCHRGSSRTPALTSPTTSSSWEQSSRYDECMLRAWHATCHMFQTASSSE